jgi:hypothetical protein
MIKDSKMHDMVFMLKGDSLSKNQVKAGKTINEVPKATSLEDQTDSK